MNHTTRIIASLLAASLLMIACGGGGGSSGSGGGFVDAVAPTVSYVAPAANHGEVGPNAKITATFSEAMNTASVTSALSLIDKVSGLPVPVQSVEYDPLNKIATMVPQGQLSTNRAYQASVSTAAKDLAGNALAVEYTWEFVTAGSADAVPPTVTSVSPANGSTSVSLNSAVSMAFSEPMDARTLNAAFSLSNGSTPVAGFLSYVGQAAVFTPDAALAPNTTYTARLSIAAKDLADNALAADVVWQFRTGASVDTAAPAVTSVTPAPGAIGVSRATSITVQFDRPFYPFFFGSIDGQVVPVVIDYATNTVTMTPAAPLAANTSYSSSVQVKSLTGTSMDAPFTWSFTTGL